MSGKREIRKQATRKSIMAAAMDLFAAKGFDGTSMEALARAAGVGKATIYGYFKTKEEIFLAFCEEEVEYAFSILNRETDPKAPLLQQLMVLHMGQFDFVTENRDFGRILMREVLFPTVQTSKRSRELDAYYLKGVGEILERAKQRGELRSDCDPLLTIGHLHGLYLLVLSSWYGGRLLSREEVRMTLRALFVQALNGLAAQPVLSPEEQGMEMIRSRFSGDVP